MRTLMKVTCEVSASNKAILDGTLPKIVEETIRQLNPESTYFVTLEGCRSMLMVFDLADPSRIPVIAEPFFLHFNAKVEFFPAMNAEDLRQGMESLMSAQSLILN